MATIVDRDAMVGLLTEEFAALSQMCRSFDEQAWATATCLPGWTVKDQLSHLAGTEQMLAGEPPPPVEVPDEPYVRNDVGRANELWVEANRARSGADVLAGFEAVTGERLAALSAMTQADFDEPSWTPVGRDETYGRFMRIRHYDCFLHEHDIRQALGLADRDEPSHVASALAETATALGYIVGRKAAMPSGSSVRIRLTGSVEVTYLVRVRERAEVVDRLDGEPTAGITLPAMLFLRLTGGRVEAAGHLGSDLLLDGDVSLAEHLAGNLAYTI
ncbi:MAG: maleylpyruvate isomerase family mycothiol-dependent enzyme [Acidimicrobiales bacterium]|jgi:uncharacterized protein (TIGR03083 family)